MKHPMILSIILGLVLAALPSIASAGCSSNKCTAPIEKLVLWADGNISIQQALSASDRQNVESAGTCTFGIYIVLPHAHMNFQEIYALLLSAKMAGASVTVRVSDTPGENCKVSYVTF